ncbi:uncharacterized protein BO72DRAFT_459548 [Aspergillus fijiensis CBS 313.89]|uniref:Uncharacterized protein n=1 Tax=Aspergillus fijiensis CBS 313.89 TaxID=1448319 RepID=A0A8G1RS91_9EURO|nr:uncharacterized protein BO72DRAFT_459548 [Aspergillus fijiensis CBS 313.89]RAK76586.1 hypothetical protein BO72DRAFT_459548 [Aspergillus fijiensis CBS 313.89]
MAGSLTWPARLHGRFAYMAGSFTWPARLPNTLKGTTAKTAITDKTINQHSSIRFYCPTFLCNTAGTPSLQFSTPTIVTNVHVIGADPSIQAECPPRPSKSSQTLRPQDQDIFEKITLSSCHVTADGDSVTVEATLMDVGCNWNVSRNRLEAVINSLSSLVWKGIYGRHGWREERMRCSLDGRSGKLGTREGRPAEGPQLNVRYHHPPSPTTSPGLLPPTLFPLSETPNDTTAPPSKPHRAIVPRRSSRVPDQPLIPVQQACGKRALQIPLRDFVPEFRDIEPQLPLEGAELIGPRHAFAVAVDLHQSLVRGDDHEEVCAEGVGVILVGGAGADDAGAFSRYRSEELAPTTLHPEPDGSGPFVVNLEPIRNPTGGYGSDDVFPGSGDLLLVVRLRHSAQVGQVHGVIADAEPVFMDGNERFQFGGWGWGIRAGRI